MVSISTYALDAFRSRHFLRPPGSGLIGGQQDTIQLEENDGFRLLALAPASNVLYGAPPSPRAEEVNTYLWVIDANGIPYVLEAPILAIGRAYPKHTNLTGGAEAFLGGEMWFTSGMALYISGGSGRYPPRDATQLEEAVQVFESFGYVVTSLGWDNTTGKAKRRLEVT